jgi:hypothetical protein
MKIVGWGQSANQRVETCVREVHLAMYYRFLISPSRRQNEIGVHPRLKPILAFCNGLVETLRAHMQFTVLARSLSDSRSIFIRDVFVYVVILCCKP